MKPPEIADRAAVLDALEATDPVAGPDGGCDDVAMGVDGVGTEGTSGGRPDTEVQAAHAPVVHRGVGEREKAPITVDLSPHLTPRRCSICGTFSSGMKYREGPKRGAMRWLALPSGAERCFKCYKKDLKKRGGCYR